MKTIIKALALLSLSAGIASADTTQTGPHTYTVDTGVTFHIVNQSMSNWLFSWTDSTGTFTNIVDPTLTLTGGETYVFDSDVFEHPFAITDDTLGVSGSDGFYSRTSFDFAIFSASILAPAADFTDSPRPAVDSISWTPENAEAINYYTCLITFHLGMTGKFIIVPVAPACPADLTGEGDLNFFDVSAFLGAFAAMDPIADFTNDGLFNFFDVSAFLGAFAAGCP